MDDLTAAYIEHEAPPASDTPPREPAFHLAAWAQALLAGWPVQPEVREALARLTHAQHQAAWRGARQDLKVIPDIPRGARRRTHVTRYLSRALAIPSRCPQTGFITCGFLRFKATARGLWVQELFSRDWKDTPTPPHHDSFAEHHALRLVRAELERLWQVVTTPYLPYTDPALFDAKELRAIEFEALAPRRKAEVENEIHAAFEREAACIDPRTLGPLMQARGKIQALAILGYPRLSQPELWRQAFHRAPAYSLHLCSTSPRYVAIETTLEALTSLPPYLAKSARRHPDIPCERYAGPPPPRDHTREAFIITHVLQMRALLLTAPAPFKAPQNRTQASTAATILQAISALPGAVNPFDGPVQASIHGLFDGDLVGWEDPRLEQLAHGIRDTIAWGGILNDPVCARVLRGLTLTQWCAVNATAHGIVIAEHNARLPPDDAALEATLGRAWLAGPVDVGPDRIVELNTIAALRQEGKAMAHCVAEYCSKVQTNTRVILSVRSQTDNLRSTCELALVHGRPAVQQLASRENARAPSRHHAAIRTLLDQVALKIIAVNGDALVKPIPGAKAGMVHQQVRHWFRANFAKRDPLKDKIQPIHG